MASTTFIWARVPGRWSERVDDCDAALVLEALFSFLLALAPDGAVRVKVGIKL